MKTLAFVLIAGFSTLLGCSLDPLANVRSQMKVYIPEATFHSTNKIGAMATLSNYTCISFDVAGYGISAPTSTGTFGLPVAEMNLGHTNPMIQLSDVTPVGGFYPFSVEVPTLVGISSDFGRRRISVYGVKPSASQICKGKKLEDYLIEDPLATLELIGAENYPLIEGTSAIAGCPENSICINTTTFTAYNPAAEAVYWRLKDRWDFESRFDYDPIPMLVYKGTVSPSDWPFTNSEEDLAAVSYLGTTAPGCVSGGLSISRADFYVPMSELEMKLAAKDLKLKVTGSGYEADSLTDVGFCSETKAITANLWIEAWDEQNKQWKPFAANKQENFQPDLNLKTFTLQIDFSSLSSYLKTINGVSYLIISIRTKPSVLTKKTALKIDYFSLY